jgi:hypothetical protein
MRSGKIVIGAILFEHDLFGKPDHALAHCLGMISTQDAPPLLGSRENRCSAGFSGSRAGGMNSGFFAWTRRTRKAGAIR